MPPLSHESFAAARVGDNFSLAQEVSTELGFETETVVLKQTAEVVQANDETYYIDLNVQQN